MTTLAWLMILAGANLVPNGGFEQLVDGRPAGWPGGWSRDGAAAIRVEPVADARSGSWALRVTHTGERDWSLTAPPGLTVQPGDILDLSVWVKLPRQGQAVLCAAVHPTDRTREPIWTAAAREVIAPLGEWTRLTSRLVIPEGYGRAEPRLIGEGPAEVFVDDFSVLAAGNLAQLRAAYAGPAQVVVRAGPLGLRLRCGDGAGLLVDGRTGRAWHWSLGAQWLPQSVSERPAGCSLEGRWLAGDHDVRVELDLARFD